MLECYDDDAHEDRDVDTKPTLFDPSELTTKLTSRFLSIKHENYNCKGMSLRLNKYLLIQA